MTKFQCDILGQEIMVTNAFGASVFWSTDSCKTYAEVFALVLVKDCGVICHLHILIGYSRSKRRLAAIS